MKAPVRRKQEISWPTIVINAGLASTIVTLGSFGTDRTKGLRDQRTSQCGVAATFLQDQKMSAYMDDATRKRLTREAVSAFERCMAEQ